MRAAFDGKVALVTGGASGIGFEVASGLCLAGATVAVIDVDEERVEGAAARLAGRGHRARGFMADVSDLGSVRGVVEAIGEDTAGLDIVVNCAGRAVPGPFLESDPATWRTLLEVDLLGTINVCYAAIPLLVSRGGGRVVNVASDAARIGSAGEAVYSAAKGGVISLTKSLAREMARHGITVNCVSPGPTDTPMLRAVVGGDERMLEKMVRATPLRRLATPEDVASAVLFLASDDAAHITGQVLSVSGGITMV